ncbi:hypothetical protein NBO_415g0003 [Nosema bombycis CQ1]|uniref:Uncharacterized protein n=1 Tax=Nosema bombycis (strain CQ1 / CVCC 102059) TaxID=578461 RepID=R0MIB9_NOSB1|nr:hypothetical protein NBO_415g0003 [Nosema bombycis CQ1]|eukprot:EOB12558.1 hypothetical protein NBO_415g0003 [Nosema bombycis CQ1]
MDKNKFKFIFESFSFEDIQNYAEDLEDEELEDFVIALEKHNSILEEKVNKKMTIEKNKKTNLDRLLRRIWMKLEEGEKKELAGFFEEMQKQVNKNIL